jgi:hypothetical protein
MHKHRTQVGPDCTQGGRKQVRTHAFGGHNKANKRLLPPHHTLTTHHHHAPQTVRIITGAIVPIYPALEEAIRKHRADITKAEAALRVVRVTLTDEGTKRVGIRFPTADGALKTLQETIAETARCVDVQIDVENSHAHVRALLALTKTTPPPLPLPHPLRHSKHAAMAAPVLEPVTPVDPQQLTKYQAAPKRTMTAFFSKIDKADATAAAALALAPPPKKEAEKKATKTKKGSGPSKKKQRK